MSEMSIGQVANQAGVQASTIRYYERIGLLPKPERLSGQRRYDSSILQKLAIIQTAQQAGFSLDELKILFDEILTSTTPTSRWHSLIQRKLHEMNQLIANIQNMKHLLEEIMECDDPNLAECIFETGLKHQIIGK